MHTWYWIIPYVTVGWSIRLLMILLILRRNFAPGAAIAWIGIIFLHPYIGLALYLIFGESRLGPGRVQHHNALVKHYQLTDSAPVLFPPLVLRPAVSPAELGRARERALADEQQFPAPSQSILPEESHSLTRLATKVGHMPVLPNNNVEFITDSAALIDRLVADIESATTQVHLLYYIFAPDSTGQKIAAALKIAAQKGVKCRLILDEFACRDDFRRNGFASELQNAGVLVVPALPGSLLRRRDLRNHRKLTIIDNRIAYCGSQNLINPDYGGKRGGPWIDLTGRFTGPIIAEFAAVFATDWAFETDEQLDVPSPADIAPIDNGVPMQIVPTGPICPAEHFRRLFLGAIDTAQQHLILTTPYFVPDEATLLSLLTAADRGVDVTLILPEQSDNALTAAAGRAHYATLLDAGIKIFLFRGGLIHTKAITIDDNISLFGSANFDVRSFHLNFELTTLTYDAETTHRLHAIQQQYIARSRQLDSKEWANRSTISHYAESAVSLISPLL
jgi:cardiolipin synthase